MNIAIQDRVLILTVVVMVDIGKTLLPLISSIIHQIVLRIQIIHKILVIILLAKV